MDKYLAREFVSLNGIGPLGEILQNAEKSLQLQSLGVIRSIMGHTDGMAAVLKVRTCFSPASICFSCPIDIDSSSHLIVFNHSSIYLEIQARSW
jgi:hypothetical protein